MLNAMSTVTSLHTIRTTLGAVLVGGLIGLFLSGVVMMQTFLYFRIYPKDQVRFKTMVVIIWFLDFFHSVMACAANWTYLINGFGHGEVSDHITPPIAITVALTAIITFLVHCFFVHRIHTLSKGNWFISLPLAALAFLRLGTALVSTSEMIRLHSFSAFVAGYAWVFTVGLSSAATLDVLIATALCFFLRRSRTGFSSMDHIIDSITLYTIENGLLTGVTTVVSLGCWVSMPNNLIFLGLHFAISKLYANSFLATLNARKTLRGKSQNSTDRDHPMPILFPDSMARRSQFVSQSRRGEEEMIGTKLSQVQISVEKTIQRDVDVNTSADTVDGDDHTSKINAI